MITIFSTLKPFEGHIGIIQRNAIHSWKKLNGDPEIILLGNESGVAEICQELNLKHIPDVKCNEYNTPYCKDTFQKAQESAKYDIVSYINGDIILTNSFIEAAIKLETYEHFLMIGQRYDLEINNLIDFEDACWEDVLRYQVNIRGKLHKYTGVDYFIFRRNDWLNIPPMVLGRIGWDNWFVSCAIKKGHTAIDATDFIYIVHQTHEYKKLKEGLTIQKGPEAIINRKLADTDGGSVHQGFTKHAPLIMTANGEIQCR